MNRSLTFLRTIVLAVSVFMYSTYASASVPQKFNYQGVIRDAAGNVQANKTLIMRMSIRATSATGSIIWQEQHTKTTNEFGLVNVVVGTGVNTGLGSAPSFSDIDWTADIHFLEVEVDFGGGMNNMGATQLLSVPYAMVADRVLNNGLDTIKMSDLADVDVTGVSTGSVLMWNGSMWVNAGEIVVDGVMSSYVSTDSIQANTIQTAVLNANNGTINLFSSTNAEIENLGVENASINIAAVDSIAANYVYGSSIESNDILTGSISSTTANIDNATISTATIDQLTVNNLTATTLNEVDGDVSNELITSASLMPNDSLVIVEGGNTHYVDLGSLSIAEVDGDVSNELIDSIYFNGPTVNINENGNIHTLNIAPLLVDNTIDSAKLMGSNLVMYPNNMPSFSVDLSSIASSGDNDQDSTNELISAVSIMNDTLFITEAGQTYEVSLTSLGLPDSITATYGNIHMVMADSMEVSDLEVTNNLIVNSMDAVFVSTDQLETPVGIVDALITQNAVIDSINSSMYINVDQINAQTINTQNLSLQSLDVDTINTTVVNAQNAVYTDTVFTDRLNANLAVISANTFIGDASTDILTVQSTSMFSNNVTMNGSQINIGNSSTDLMDVDATTSFNNEVTNQGLVTNLGNVENFALVNNYSQTYMADSLVSDGPVKLNNNVVIADSLLSVNVGSNAVSIKATSVTIGSGGSALTKIVKAIAIVDVPSINPGSFSNLSVTVEGVNLGSVVTVNPESELGNVLIGGARVSATDTITIKFYNPSGAIVNPAAMNFYFLIVE